MKDFCNGLVWGMFAGACIGAIVVVKNKKLSNKLKDGLNTAEEKFQEIKDDITQKIENSKECNCQDNDFQGQDCGCGGKEMSGQVGENSNFKKSKN